MDDNIKMKRLVVFSILMENNGGIINKSPNCILENFHSCMIRGKPETLLDSQNLMKLMEYGLKWK